MPFGPGLTKFSMANSNSRVIVFLFKVYGIEVRISPSNGTPAPRSRCGGIRFQSMQTMVVFSPFVFLFLLGFLVFNGPFLFGM